MADSLTHETGADSSTIGVALVLFSVLVVSFLGAADDLSAPYASV